MTLEDSQLRLVLDHIRRSNAAGVIDAGMLYSFLSRQVIADMRRYHILIIIIMVHSFLSDGAILNNGAINNY